MRLNQATDYAFRAVLHLSRLPRGKVVEAKLIAGEEHIPIRFLLKILRYLTRAGIVESYRGVSGGYALAKSPGDITMKDVVEAVEGPIRINRCLIDPGECNRRQTSSCVMHRALFSIQQALARELEKYDFEALSRMTPPGKLPGQNPGSGGQNQ
ncbi:MAG: RrF2 family transcriptional regulator [Bacillota bacterium]